MCNQSFCRRMGVLKRVLPMRLASCLLIILGVFLVVNIPRRQQLGNQNVIDPEHDWMTVQQQRQAILNSICAKYKLYNHAGVLNPSVARMLYVEHAHRFIYCEVPKAGCTNWKRLLILLRMNLTRDLTEVSTEFLHNRSVHTRLSSFLPEEQKQLLNNYTKVMFTREPFERLVYAYRDKFLGNNPDKYYLENVANYIKSKFRRAPTSKGPVSFQEFVSFVLEEEPWFADIHWKPMFELCDPCNIHYDILGKMETLKKDSDQVLKAIGASSKLHFPKTVEHATGTNKEIMESYVRNLSSTHILSLNNRFLMDFLLFNYSLV